MVFGFRGGGGGGDGWRFHNGSSSSDRTRAQRSIAWCVCTTHKKLRLLLLRLLCAWVTEAVKSTQTRLLSDALEKLKSEHDGATESKRVAAARAVCTERIPSLRKIDTALICSLNSLAPRYDSATRGGTCPLHLTLSSVAERLPQ